MEPQPIVILTYGIARAATAAEGKFVQFIWRGREHLVFAPLTLHRYHNMILGQFLEENAIAHRWIDEQVLHLESAEVRVLGGGRFRVDTRARTLELCDNSQAYGRFDERGLAQKIAHAESPWRRYSVTIAE